jgi:biotin-(acetyl-CoA carboxylase) ligase
MLRIGEIDASCIRLSKISRKLESQNQKTGPRIKLMEELLDKFKEHVSNFGDYNSTNAAAIKKLSALKGANDTNEYKDEKLKQNIYEHNNFKIRKSSLNREYKN